MGSIFLTFRSDRPPQPVAARSAFLAAYPAYLAVEITILSCGTTVDTSIPGAILSSFYCLSTELFKVLIFRVPTTLSVPE